MFFIMRMVRYWNKLTEEYVDATSLELFKVRPDGALSNLIWQKMSLPMAGRLDLHVQRSFPTQRIL